VDGGRQSRYRHPVPDANDVILALQASGVPQSFDALAATLGVQEPRHRHSLRKRLQEMASAGRLLLNRRGEYCLIEKLDAVTGIVSAHRDGYGFLITSDDSGDVFLPPDEMRQLLDGDRVAVRLAGSGPRGRRAGTVVEILERGKQSVVGRYVRERGVGYVVEGGRSARHYLVPDAHRGGAADGHFVKIEIITYPGVNREAQGKVVKLLGSPEEDPKVATDAALEIFGLPAVFPPEARRAAADLGPEVREEDKAGRVDLRGLPLVTIDGADARDFDDAVYAEPDHGGWRLLVAIADVSHYVQAGDPLDREAAHRSTSAYFPDRVVPMLPEQLSNGLCSLNPGVDRLCMVCEMRVSAAGEVGGARFYRAVMRSRQRLVYEEVQAARDGDAAARQRVQGVQSQLDSLYGVFSSLEQARQRRGALELELPETQITLGSDGRIAGISLRQRNDAHRLIEECMIAANVQAAKFLQRRHLPTLYRVHAGPDEEKFENLRLMLQALGAKVTSQARARPREINRILASMRDRPDYPMLATAVLRTMSQAVYQPANIGHFGLGLATYTHFTSPIRRYPDLLVHRGIGHLLDHGKPAAYRYDLAGMELLGRLTSERERRAEEAARHVESRYKCAYVKDRIGEVVDGVVSGLTHFGLFVTLTALNVDGLVHVTSLRNDYYHLGQGGLRLVGERTGQGYGLGERLRVRILRVDVDEARIDLGLEEDMPVTARRSRRPASGPRRGPQRRR